MPRYYRLFLSISGVPLVGGAASYPALHVFESWTNYDTPTHGVVSVLFVFLTFFPAGLMKSYFDAANGKCVGSHAGTFHAVTPHVMVDTRLVVNDFNIR